MSISKFKKIEKEESNQKTKTKVEVCIFENYLKVIENSIGSRVFKNLYAYVNGEKRDILRDGDLSCAFFVSSILHMFDYLKQIRTTVDQTAKDLLDAGWKKIKKPRKGSIIVWSPGEKSNGHKHIGFYVGNNLAVNNDSFKKHPVKCDWKFGGKRKVEMILWKTEMDKK